MKYKILYIKNRYTKSQNFDRGLDWFKANTPIEIEATDHIVTDFDVDFYNVGNSTYQGVAVSETIYDKLRPLIPVGKYHAVVFLYGNNAPGIRLNQAHFNPILPGTQFVQVCQDSDKGKTLNHELIHSMFHRLRAQGIIADDPMDYVFLNGKVEAYFRNDSLTANPSNRTIAVQRLAPFWNQVVAFGPVTPPTPPAPVSPYKWFKMNEKTGPNHTFSELDPKLRAVLDASREGAGVPFVLTSGMRTPAENLAVGGVANSAHLKGLAADILCTDGIKLTSILRGILNCGTPVFLEVANKHVHIDIDASIHQMGKTIIEPNDD